MVNVAVLQFVGPSTLVPSLTSNNFRLTYFLIILDFLLTTIPIHTSTPCLNTHCYSGGLENPFIRDPRLLQLKCHIGC